MPEPGATGISQRTSLSFRRFLGAGTLPSARTIRYIGAMRNTKTAAGACTGILDVNGASCPSCAYTIERAGRRVAGVHDVRVDVNAHEIRVEYDGSPEALTGVQAIVARLGYQASVKSSGTPAG
jgi:copper chaperone CopZ